jgi:hypothetical protein
LAAFLVGRLPVLTVHAFSKTPVIWEGWSSWSNATMGQQRRKRKDRTPMPGANHDQHAERRQGTQGADGHHEDDEHDHGEHGHGHRTGLLGRLTELVAPHSHDAAVAVDKGRSREAFGLVASLPASARCGWCSPLPGPRRRSAPRWSAA